VAPAAGGNVGTPSAALRAGPKGKAAAHVVAPASGPASFATALCERSDALRARAPDLRY